MILGIVSRGPKRGNEQNGQTVRAEKAQRSSSATAMRKQVSLQYVQGLVLVCSKHVHMFDPWPQSHLFTRPRTMAVLQKGQTREGVDQEYNWGKATP